MRRPRPELLETTEGKRTRAAPSRKTPSIRDMEGTGRRVVSPSPLSHQ
jgi:hypothetical protein